MNDIQGQPDLFLEGLTLFNSPDPNNLQSYYDRSPRNAIKFWMEHGLIPQLTPPSPTTIPDEHLTLYSIAFFLHSTPGLKRTSKGIYLTDPSDEIKQVRQYFMSLINLESKDVFEALCELAEHHLMFPGEASKIDKLLEAFAERYLECNPAAMNQFKSEDCLVNVLFAILFLNQELYGSKTKRPTKRTRTEFILTYRDLGIGGSKDANSAYFGELYDKVKGRRIIIWEEERERIDDEQETTWCRLF
ncbi:SEC7-like protein [Rhizoclosmatium globosum]|uniref:SEC7-like protein n=1 Tax=Rhizoclosmatium globosum TaxID=329046 RepID=A0A1Y2CVY3_9FUNG|nr:SEC7-like protein [Rhizoclosmatium globosum]|eukprot:ORY50495.1 SEC7-like protein [Rhizoclosmatium globosum]